MLNIVVPQPDETSPTAKDAVFSILAREKLLSLAELTRRVHTQYHVGVTYQAVRKATETLVRERVLEKEDKRYKIRKEWVLRTKSFFDQLLMTLEGNADVHAFTDALKKEDYVVYTFHTLLDLDNFWGDVMLHWAQNLKKGDDRRYFSYGHYAFWMLINLGRETRLFDDMLAYGVKPAFLFLNESPLNQWTASIYRERGVKAIVRKGLRVDDSTGLNLLGDTVLQVHYPEKILKRLRGVYSGARRIEDINHKRIADIVHEHCEIKFVLFKNPALARDIREKYSPLFT